MDQVKKSKENAKTRTILNDAKKIYVSDLKKQTDAIGRLLEDLDHQFQLELGKELYRIVHTIKGSAPMFGFIRTGKIAEELTEKWEWVNQGKSEMRISQLLAETDRLLVQLKVEYEIYVKELEADQVISADPEEKPAAGNRLLLIDDDRTLLSYLKKRFELIGYRADEVDNVETAVKKLQDEAYDMIILDLMMYPQSGYDLFQFLKEDPKFKWIPIIVLSGRDQVDDKVRCLRLGADDYVTKPFYFEELEARVTNLLNRVKFFEQMAFRDALTGVYNRRYFDHMLRSELQRAERTGKPLSLAFIDIDHFKRVNDEHGHQIGDLVLQGLAFFFQQQIRRTDLLARYGGEEFVVVFPETKGSDAYRVIEKIVERVRTQPVIQHDGHDFYVTLSAGVAGWQEGNGLADLIRASDGALYQAKQSGRNRSILFEGPIGLPNGQDAPKSARKKVLIADDDASIRSLLTAMLGEMDVDVTLAEDGEAAWSILKETPIDLCIADGIMPKLDGFALLRQIKADPCLQGTKVMMLTARKHKENSSEQDGRTADDYIAKPFSLVELEVRLKRMLGLLN